MAKIEHRPTARVLNILELLAANQEGLTLTEIAEAIDAPKSSVLPLIHTMAQRKFIFFDVHTYKYSIGIGSFCVGSAYTSNMNALQFIKSEMKYIVKKTNEIYLEAPRTSDKAVERARVALEVKKDNTFSDEEIDLFLP